ncbi:enoyl-CoA hydratase/isomerase family protein [bacterium]|nr:enoyl-CoA hydratase/isomerase family protein [bacterium]
MSFVEVTQAAGIVTVKLARGKVNAVNAEVVESLHSHLETLRNDSNTKAIILTGQGKFFSFGFDIPELFPYSKSEFARFLEKFTDLYADLFIYPKPIIAALNGHAVAGGGMLALACDRRIMVSGKAKISLNEIGFGSSVFAGSVEMLRFAVGSANASEILYSGAMYSAEDAQALGLVHEVTTKDELVARAIAMATDLGEKASDAFASIKTLLRRPVFEEIKRRELESIREFVEIWYSESTQENLKQIKIY